jgi:lysyl-tRNA synthetase class II
MTNKVFPNYAYEDTEIPFIVYSKKESAPIKTLDKTHDLIDAMYEVYITATTYSSLMDISEKVKNKIIEMTNKTYGGSTTAIIQDVTLQSTEEFYSDDMDCHVLEMQARFFYRQLFN